MEEENIAPAEETKAREETEAQEEMGEPESKAAETPLSKEEVLARSRKENKSGDEREQTKWKWVPYCGYIAMIAAMVVLIICFVFLHMVQEFISPLFAVMATGLSAQITCQAVVMPRGKGKTISIVCAVFVVLSTIGLWVVFGVTFAGM